MPNPKNIANHKMKPGQTLNPHGRPLGSRNRSTVARQILSIIAKYPDEVFADLLKLYPELQKEMTIEEMMTVVQADKAIRKQDTNAYKALMDSAHGAPKQEFEMVERERQCFKIDGKDIYFD
jgi:hypothetical protein